MWFWLRAAARKAVERTHNFWIFVDRLADPGQEFIYTNLYK